MFRGVRDRLSYANVVSTLALVFAIGGGAAYAANTVFSTDIVDGEVKSPDIAVGAVKGAKVDDDAIKAKHIANGQVKSLDIARGGVQSDDVLNDDLTGTDIDESTLEGLGPTATSFVDATESTTSTTPADLATPGPSVTVDVPADSMVSFFVTATVDGTGAASGTCRVILDLPGGLDDVNIIGRSSGSAPLNLFAPPAFRVLPEGEQTISLKYQSDGGNGTTDSCAFADRGLGAEVIPG